MYTLKLKHSFCAAHQLEHAYSEECNLNIHGHNWNVLVKIQTDKLRNGMVVDFKRVKEVINKLDHKNLNTILDFEPTAENIAHYLYQEIEKLKVQDLWIVSVTVWEAEDTSITYSL